MTEPAERHDWDEEDLQLDAEHRALLELVESGRRRTEVPSLLDRKVLRLAREKTRDRLSRNWLLGQGPRVILVTLILFAIAMMILMMR